MNMRYEGVLVIQRSLLCSYKGNTRCSSSVILSNMIKYRMTKHSICVSLNWWNEKDIWNYDATDFVNDVRQLILLKILSKTLLFNICVEWELCVPLSDENCPIRPRLYLPIPSSLIWAISHRQNVCDIMGESIWSQFNYKIGNIEPRLYWAQNIKSDLSVSLNYSLFFVICQNITNATQPAYLNVKISAEQTSGVFLHSQEHQFQRIFGMPE